MIRSVVLGVSVLSVAPAFASSLNSSLNAPQLLAQNSNAIIETQGAGYGPGSPQYTQPVTSVPGVRSAPGQSQADRDFERDNRQHGRKNSGERRRDSEERSSRNDDDMPWGSSQGLGVVLGTSSGVGVGYRGFFDWLGIQIAGIPYGDKTSFHFDVGAQVMAVFNENRESHLRFYGLASSAIFYGSKKEGSALPELWNKSGRWFIGSGVGVEFLWPHLGLALELPIVLNLDINDGIDFESVYPIPAVALMYYF